MKKQADSVTTAVPTSFTPAVPSHVKPIPNNHVPASVDLSGDGIIIVCGLAAPRNPGISCPERQRRTFWTACRSCKKVNKHSIEHLNCNISCPDCKEIFKATEVPRRRKQRTATINNVYSEATVTYLGNTGEPCELKPTVETPLRKKVKREMNATHAAGKREKTLEGSCYKQKTNTVMETNIIRGMIHHEKPVPINIRKRISKDEIKIYLMSKSRNMVMEVMHKGNNKKN